MEEQLKLRLTNVMVPYNLEDFKYQAKLFGELKVTESIKSQIEHIFNFVVQYPKILYFFDGYDRDQVLIIGDYLKYDSSFRNSILQKMIDGNTEALLEEQMLRNSDVLKISVDTDNLEFEAYIITDSELHHIEGIITNTGDDDLSNFEIEIPDELGTSLEFQNWIVDIDNFLELQFKVQSEYIN